MDNKLSKFISLVLRHDPSALDIQLDDKGWTPLSTLIKKLKKNPKWQWVHKKDIEQIIAESEKKRFEIEDDRIRACYGHSIEKEIKLEECIPPEILYHGTSPATVPAIFSQGVKPMGRQKVHLSSDIFTAFNTGRRKCKLGQKPQIFQVDAKRATENGIKFYKGNGDIYLSDLIPNTFIKILYL